MALIIPIIEHLTSQVPKCLEGIVNTSILVLILSPILSSTHKANDQALSFLGRGCNKDKVVSVGKEGESICGWKLLIFEGISVSGTQLRKRTKRMGSNELVYKKNSLQHTNKHMQTHE